MNESNFIPRILLCGDEEEFLSRVGNRPFKIIGNAKLSSTFKEDGKIFFNNELQDLIALRSFLQSGVVDYFVFNDINVLRFFISIAARFGFGSSKNITLEEFKATPTGFPYYVDAEITIATNLKGIGIKTLLDVDGYFAQGKLFTKLNNVFMEIDAVSEKPLPPITENIYSHVYKNLAEVGFKHYDAVLIAEHKPIDFSRLFILTGNFSDKIITFAQTGSELEKYLGTNNGFEKKASLQTNEGMWHLLIRHKLPEDFAVYVVTHKPTPHDGKLPDGYKIIHAGRALKENLGYLGDNTGDNISRLNPYVNEITALYWMWKNTSHTVIGLNHYRRFFTEFADATFAYEKILTRDAALRVLESYDIIVVIPHIGYIQRENIQGSCGEQLTVLGEVIIKKHLMQNQPEYIEAFDIVLNSKSFYMCNMFITRKNIFDAYCKWLFSFYIDAIQEILQTDILRKAPGNQSRLMGFFAERLPTVWLIKNRVRIKELNMMFINGI